MACLLDVRGGREQDERREVTLRHSEEHCEMTSEENKDNSSKNMVL
jgi:hypothetical protein